MAVLVPRETINKGDNPVNTDESIQNNTYQNINSYTINTNHDGTYSVKIETDAYTLSYPKTNVIFSANQSIAFPIAIVILNKDGEALFNYALNLQNAVPVDADNTEEGTEQ